MEIYEGKQYLEQVKCLGVTGVRISISDSNISLFRKLIINSGLARLAEDDTLGMKAGEPKKIFILLSVLLIDLKTPDLDNDDHVRGLRLEKLSMMITGNLSRQYIQ